MPKGNQSYFKSTNETVERYALISKFRDEETICGIYEDLGRLKCGMKNQGWYRKDYRVAKVRITIEELEEIQI
jgi:hypothetical protein